MTQASDMCPICHHCFKSHTCKHSVHDVDEFLANQKVKKLAKDTVSKSLQSIDDRLTMIDDQLQTLLGLKNDTIHRDDIVDPKTGRFWRDIAVDHQKKVFLSKIQFALTMRDPGGNIVEALTLSWMDMTNKIAEFTNAMATEELTYSITIKPIK